MYIYIWLYMWIHQAISQTDAFTLIFKTSLSFHQFLALHFTSAIVIFLFNPGSSATLALMILTLHQVPSNPGHKRHLCGLMAFFSTKPSSQNAFLPQSCVSVVQPNPRQGITKMESNWCQGSSYSECVWYYPIQPDYTVQRPYIVNKYVVYAQICEITKAGGISLHMSITLWSCWKVKISTQPSLLCRTSTALT